MNSTNSSLLDRRTGNVLAVGRRLFVIAVLAIFLVGSWGVINAKSDAIAGVLTYVMLLALLCGIPLMLARRINGRESILVFFFAFYFIAFGVADVVRLTDATTVYQRRDGLLTEAEWVIIAGGLATLLGYGAVLALTRPRGRGVLQQDWSITPTLVVALLCWALGLYINYLWQFQYADSRSGVELTNPFGGVLSLLRNLQPFATILLAYLAIARRNGKATAALLVTVLVDIVFGFVADSKELSIRSPALIVLTFVLLKSRTPWKGLLLLAVGVAVSWPLFTAYRFEILQTGEQSRMEALTRIGSNLDRVLERLEDDRGTEGLVDPLTRVTLKPNVEMVVARTGRGVEFQDGETLKILGYAFIPRYFMPDKPDTSIGQVFNRAFRVSADPDTYISTTHIGELYWNFGWSAVLVGMFVIGMVLGTIGTLFRLDQAPNLPRLIVVLLTIYFLCLRFEGGIGLQYTFWLRTLAMVLLLHLIMPKERPAATNSA